MEKTYYDINEVMDEIRVTLGTEFEDEYDVEGIAREVTDYNEFGGMVADLDREDYWVIVAQYQN